VGELVGVDVAAELDYRYVDREVVTRAAEKAQVDRSAVENAERRRSFVRRLLEGLASPAALPDAMSGTEGPFSPSPVPGSGDAWDIRDVIRSVIGDIADEGRVVIVSHAASMALAGAPNVLRVLVTASPDVRAKRISRGGKWLEPAAAAAAIRDADRNRQDYFRRFYDIDREDVTHYDLVLSTDVLTPKQAAAIVCSAARIAGE
jgi:hypothetical protein